MVSIEAIPYGELKRIVPSTRITHESEVSIEAIPYGELKRVFGIINAWADTSLD